VKELIFIGMGLWDKGGLPLAAMEILPRCERIFAEFYTAKLTPEATAEIQDEIGKEIELLDRESVENNDTVITALKEATGDVTVAFLCAGDPLTATTHQELRIRARAEGFSTRIIPAASIVTAAPALVGLSIYKFGRITTIPFPEEGFFPQSPYDVIRENLDRGCHSLILLDIQAHKDKYMTANQGMEYLLELEAKLSKKVIGEDTLICVVARAGSPDPTVRVGYVKDMIKEDFGPPLHSIILPGTMHFMEAEALVAIGGADEGILKDY